MSQDTNVTKRAGVLQPGKPVPRGGFARAKGNLRVLGLSAEGWAQASLAENGAHGGVLGGAAALLKARKTQSSPEG